MSASETDHGNQHEMAFGNRAVTKNRLSIGETTGSTWKISKTKSKKIRVHEKKIFLIKLILSEEQIFFHEKKFFLTKQTGSIFKLVVHAMNCDVSC